MASKFVLQSVGFLSQVRLGNTAAPYDSIHRSTTPVDGTRIDNGQILFELDAELDGVTIHVIKSKVKHFIPMTNVSYLKWDPVEDEAVPSK